jgi:hypothetical protein
MIRDDDFKVLVRLAMERIIDGCQNVKGEEDIHQDAKDLATHVLRDCNNVLSLMEYLI